MDPVAEKGKTAEDEQTVGHLRDRPGVLVVDAEHMVRVMVQLALERESLDVWLASSGREAIHLYHKHRDEIDVVLLDEGITDLEWPQTLDAMRELNPKVLVCFMSGATDRHRTEELRQRGAACVVAKPFRLDHLVRVLRLLLLGVPPDLSPSGEGCQR
jgi:DNA-binding response OmpR family regulator